MADNSIANQTYGPWIARDAYIIPAAHAERPIGAHTDPVKDVERYAQPICTMRTRYGVNKGHQALLAAAPDLLAALQTFVKYLADTDDEGLIEHVEPMIAARAAIAKAGGPA